METHIASPSLREFSSRSVSQPRVTRTFCGISNASSSCHGVYVVRACTAIPAGSEGRVARFPTVCGRVVRKRCGGGGATPTVPYSECPDNYLQLSCQNCGGADAQPAANCAQRSQRSSVLFAWCSRHRTGVLGGGEVLWMTRVSTRNLAGHQIPHHSTVTKGSGY